MLITFNAKTNGARAMQPCVVDVPFVQFLSYIEKTMEETQSRHRKELKTLEGEKRAALKKAKGTKGKKAKEVLKACVQRSGCMFCVVA
jgi:hypothetical protein